MPKIYSFDLGMRNLAVGIFNDFSLRADRGEMVENFVFTEIQRTIGSPDEIHFWRTQTKAEVDLVIELGTRVVPVEVKFKPMVAPQVSRSFRSFLKVYNPPLALLFTQNYLDKLKINNTEVLFLPFWSLLFFELNYLK